MTSFVGKGADIARALDNALLFCDPKAEYLPGVVHVEFSAGGIAFSACDDYATGRDSVGVLTPPNIGHFDITEESADAIVKAARSARSQSVTLALDELSFVLTVGEVETVADADESSDAWDDILPLIDVDAHESQDLPPTVAFSATRFARFGRVKALKDAPMDVRFMATEGAPLALIKIGPTFRGELQGVRRDEAMEHLGEGAEDCFW